MNAEARCLGCNYLLRGLPENRCPECGREFDPNDPRTMNLGSVIGAAARWWLSPPGWPLFAAASAAAIILLYSYHAPGRYFGPWISGSCLELLILLWWGLRLAVGLGIAWYYRQLEFRNLRKWGRWGVVPIVAVTTVVLLWMQLPLLIAFWISQPDMERLVQQVRRDPRGSPRSAMVGLYEAAGIETVSGGVRFIVCDTGFYTVAGGFAYFPSGTAPTPEYKHLWGKWFTWWYSVF
jgi:hypothetical protein